MDTRRLDIQGLRALAVALVVLYHAGLPLPGGFVGVDVFFVISGFVITAMLRREMATHGRVDLRRFYARRVKRLLPAMVLMLVVVMALSVLLPSPLGQPQETIKTALGAIALSANIELQRSVAGYFALSAKDNALLHTWSLSVEEQFYLVFPTLLAVTWLLERRVRAVALTVSAVLLGALAILSFGLVLVIPRGLAFIGLAEGTQSFVFFSATTRAWEFLIGALLALFAPRMHCSRRVGGTLVGVGLVAIAGASVLLSEQAPFPDWNAWLPVGGTMLVIAGGSVVGDSRRNPLIARPMVRIGDWSYSWYLWHWPVIVFAVQVYGRSLPVTLVAAGASLLPAVLSFTYVEDPLRTAPGISTAGSAVLFAGAVVTTLAVAFVAERTVHFGWGQPWSMGAHVAMQRGCDKQPSDFTACTWGAPGKAGSVLIVGDSQSWALADGVIAAASSLGMSTTVASHNGCPFVHPDVADRIAGRACRDSITRTLNFVREKHPTVLVIANTDTYGERIGDGYARLLEALPFPTVQLIVVRPPPGGDGYSGRQSILVRSGPATRQRAQSEPDLIITRLLDGIRGRAQILDPRDTLCQEGACSVAIDGNEVYSNSNHLSVPGAMLLMPQLVRALEFAVAGQ